MTSLPPLTIGTLTLERYGFITTDEDDLIADLLAAEPSALEEAARLADGIAVAEDITLLEAYRVVGDAVDGKPLSDDAEALLLRHAGAIQQATRLFNRAGQARSRACVTALLRLRGGIDGIPPRFPRKHFAAVWELYQAEEAAEAMPQQELTEELLGKQLPASSADPMPDGATASGSCAMPSPDSSAAALGGESPGP